MEHRRLEAKQIKEQSVLWTKKKIEYPSSTIHWQYID